MNKLLSSLAFVLSLWVTLSLCVIMNDQKLDTTYLDKCCAVETVEDPISSTSPAPSDHTKIESVEKKLVAGELTFGIIKPNAVLAGFTGEIIRIIELNGFNIEKMEKKQLTKKEAEEFYKEHKAKPFFKDLVHFMISGPVVILKLKKADAVVTWRKLMGATNPERAEVGTLRAMFGEDVTHNAVHGSDSDANAERELSFFNLM